MPYYQTIALGRSLDQTAVASSVQASCGYLDWAAFVQALAQGFQAPVLACDCIEAAFACLFAAVVVNTCLDESPVFVTAVGG